MKDALNKSKQLVYFRNDLKAGESVIIANLKLEKGNKATAYTPCPTDDPVMYDNMIYDTSGYCNNGSVSGDILWDTNTPRYNGAYDFNGTGYIYNDNLNLTTTAFTISFWIKIPSAITHQHFDFATFNSWTSEGVGIYWDTSGQKSSSGGIFGKDSNGDKIHVGVQCRGKLNEWTHFAITWDGTNVYRYSNGIKFSESDFNAVSVYHPRLWLGNSTFGDRTLENSESCMSDFRFYTTALSDSDILELYQSSASVDNNGNLMLAGEVIEGNIVTMTYCIPYNAKYIYFNYYKDEINDIFPTFGKGGTCMVRCKASGLPMITYYDKDYYEEHGAVDVGDLSQQVEKCNTDIETLKKSVSDEFETITEKIKQIQTVGYGVYGKADTTIVSNGTARYIYGTCTIEQEGE